MKDLTNLTGFTIISNTDYRALVEKNQELLQKNFEMGGMCVEIQQLKTALLEVCYEKNEHNFKAFSLDDLLKVNSSLFAFDNATELFKLGFTYDELAEFITKKKNDLLMKEKEQTENDGTNLGEDLKNGAEEIGEDIKDGAEDLGDDIRNGTENSGNSSSGTDNAAGNNANGTQNNDMTK